MTLSQLKQTTKATTGKTSVRATKLHGFTGDYATYTSDGKNFEAVRVGGRWYLTGTYTY